MLQAEKDLGLARLSSASGNAALIATFPSWLINLPIGSSVSGLWLATDPEDAVEKVSDVDAGLRHHRRQLLPQLEFLPDDHHPTQVLQGRVSLRHRQGQSHGGLPLFWSYRSRDSDIPKKNKLAA